MERQTNGERSSMPAWCRALLITLATAMLPATAAAETTRWRKASDDELRKVAARGLPDRLLAGRSLFLGSGNAIEMLGDTGALLNPIDALLELTGTRFQRLLFDPANMAILTDASGAAYIRVFTYIPGATLDNTRVGAVNGPSYGSFTMRNIDLRGTTIVVKRNN